MRSSTSISLLLKSDFTDLLVIADVILGKKYITTQELLSYVGGTSKIGLVAETNGEISGFQLLQICSYNELMGLALSEKAWFNNQFSNNFPVGVLKTIVVNSKFQKQGIGTMLTENSLKILRKSTNKIFSICWSINELVPYASILQRCGMKQVHKIDGFWKEDSLAKKYNCCFCNKPPCLCNAFIYLS